MLCVQAQNHALVHKGHVVLEKDKAFHNVTIVSVSHVEYIIFETRFGKFNPIKVEANRQVLLAEKYQQEVEESIVINVTSSNIQARKQEELLACDEKKKLCESLKSRAKCEEG
jgi:hypothetical protein